MSIDTQTSPILRADSDTENREFDTPRRARVGVDPHLPRGGRRVRAAGDPVLRRQDSTLLLHLALKAFWPAPLLFSLLHVDTGHNLPEIIEFRDEIVARHNLWLHVASVEGVPRRRPAHRASRRHPQPAADHPAARRHHREPLRRGVRRRPPRRGARPRQGAGLLPRNAFGQWDPKRQRPELWNLYNGRHAPASTSACSR